MSHNLYNVLFLNTFILILNVFVSVPSHASQSTAVKPATATQNAQLAVATTNSNRFSGEVQQALEAGNTRQALKLCGSSCTSKHSGTITSPQPGALKDYQCQNGNCACTSIPDCVKMTEVCAPGTTGCNDYGCTCAEK